ncbi:FG-GAP-like repeat-containing protein [Fulvivirga lutea]|uniref:CRTAC1 family protein n=1 Tax=Fulvivirga lutea TaxID=2810512 RepID=A0A974ZZT4_9BACT|nr:FG-GAP-like repeat-containing protein [Fulvivirga lutea]QSE96639.1 CRTAC1 family protein [Fulvivirga lutea]
MLRFIIILLSLVISTFVSAQFIDVSQDLGITTQYGTSTLGGGVSFYDFNADGLDDLTLATSSGQSIKFFINKGNGQFEQIDLLPEEKSESKHVLWIDYDNDGNTDFFVSNFDDINKLYKNTGSLKLIDVTESVNLPLSTLTSLGVDWGDFDRDGFLDLYVTDKRYDGKPEFASNKLYKNINGNSFLDVTLELGVADSAKLPFCASFFDYDRDRWQDIYIVQDLTPLSTLLNNRSALKFKNTSIRSGSSLPRTSGMGIALGDYDNNGFEDIYVTNIQNGNRLLMNDSSMFTEVAENANVTFNGFCWGANFFDMDNDGDLDLYVSGSLVGSHVPSSALFENKSSGNFERFEQGFVGDTVASYANAIGDLDSDGLLDIAVNNINDYQSQIWHNLGADNNWIKFDLEGTLSPKDAYGSLIRIFVNGKEAIQRKYCGIGFLGQNSKYVHFGLNNNQSVDSVIVEWTSGHNDTVRSVSINQINKLKEGRYSVVKPKLVIEGKDYLCPGEGIVLGSSIYSSKFDYSWSNGSSSPMIIVEESGIYRLEVDIGGRALVDSINLQIEFAESPNPDVIINDVNCFGNEDGEIFLSGESLSFVEWEDGINSFTKKMLPPAKYNVVIGNNFGCELDTSLLVSEPEELVINITYTTLEPNEFNVYASVSGGVEPYNYLWNDALKQTNDTITINLPGIYELTIRDKNDCFEKKVIRIEDPILDSDESLNSEILKVFPNPVQDYIFIDNSNGIFKSYEIVDVIGKLINYGTLENDLNQIKLSQHNNSRLIILTLSGDKEKRRMKILFQD